MQQERVFRRASTLEGAKRCFAPGAPGRSQPGQGRIPHELWTIAAEAAAVGGLQATARQLQLSLPTLNRWMRSIGPIRAGATGKRRQASREGAQFLELPPLGLVSAAGCTVELKDKSGRKVHVVLKGAATGEAVALGGCCGGATHDSNQPVDTHLGGRRAR